jgi:drug/metabolite transporter (DMT)-like permease
VDSAPGDATAAAHVSVRLRSLPAALLGDPRVLVPLLLLVESVHYVFARLLVPLAPPATAGLYMMTIATAEVGLVAGRRIDPRAFLRHWRFFTTIGLLVAVNTNLGFLAVHYIDPGTAALLTRTSVIFGVGLGLLWLGERLTAIELVGGVLAVTGVFIVGFQPGDYLRLGSLIAVAASLLYAIHSAVVKRYGSQIAFADFFFFRLAGTSAFLLVLAAAQGALVLPGPAAWPILGLAATFNVVISRAVYYLALRRLDMSRLTIMLTLNPVLTMLWSFLLFGSLPSAPEVLGGLAILSGVIVVSASHGGLFRRSHAPVLPS